MATRNPPAATPAGHLTAGTRPDHDGVVSLAHFEYLLGDDSTCGDTVPEAFPTLRSKG